jgi:hypothetical protein
MMSYLLVVGKGLVSGILVPNSIDRLYALQGTYINIVFLYS